MGGGGGSNLVSNLQENLEKCNQIGGKSCGGLLTQEAKLVQNPRVESHSQSFNQLEYQTWRDNDSDLYERIHPSRS